MSLKIAVAFALLVVALARPDTLPTSMQLRATHKLGEYFEGPNYDFSHAVHDDESGNNFGHQETRDDAHTQGSYYVHLPDGRLQKVTYYVDGDSGFVAEVSYEGEARYPEHDSSEERYAYAPPKSLYSAPN